MTFMPRDVAEKIRSIGPVIDPPATAAVYAPLHEKEPYSGVKVTRDIKYGPDARQALDLFVPEGAGISQPVFIFIHGGGYTGGHKREGNNFFYDNIMLWAAKHGMIGVNATYRLAPAHAWPAGPEDVAGAVRWVLGNIAAHGGDPKRVFLCGHSAGGTHVASYAVMPQFHRVDGSGLKGLILISGNYDLSDGQDAGRALPELFRRRRLQIRRALAVHGAVETAGSAHDGLCRARAAVYRGTKRESRNRAARRQAELPLIKLKGHSHISITYSINTKDTELSDAMLEFIKNLN